MALLMARSAAGATSDSVGCPPSVAPAPAAAAAALLVILGTDCATAFSLFGPSTGVIVTDLAGSAGLKGDGEGIWSLRASSFSSSATLPARVFTMPFRRTFSPSRDTILSRIPFDFTSSLSGASLRDTADNGLCPLLSSLSPPLSFVSHKSSSSSSSSKLTAPSFDSNSSRKKYLWLQGKIII